MRDGASGNTLDPTAALLGPRLRSPAIPAGLPPQAGHPQWPSQPTGLVKGRAKKTKPMVS